MAILGGQGTLKNYFHHIRTLKRVVLLTLRRDVHCAKASTVLWDFRRSSLLVGSHLGL